MAAVQLNIGIPQILYGSSFLPACRNTGNGWVLHMHISNGSSQVVQVVKYPSASAGDLRDTDSIPESGRSPGREHGNTLQYSCLENPMDRGAWRGPRGHKEWDITEVT